MTTILGRLGLHVNVGRSIRTGEPLVSFVGSVPSSLAFEAGATAEHIEKGRKFGGRFGPEKRFWPSAAEAWAEAERQGFARCAIPTCMCNSRNAG